MRPDIMRHVRDVNADFPSLIDGNDMNGIIKIPSIIRVDREDRQMPKIDPAFELTLGNFGGNPSCLFEHWLREVSRQAVLLNNTEYFNSRVVRRPQHFDDLAFRTDMPVFPFAQADHYLVVDRRLSSGGIWRQRHINV